MVGPAVDAGIGGRSRRETPAPLQFVGDEEVGDEEANQRPPIRPGTKYEVMALAVADAGGVTPLHGLM